MDWSFLKFWKQKKEDNKTDSNLSKLGLTTIQDEKLGARTDIYGLLSERIQSSYGLEGNSEEVVEEIINRIHEINSALHQVAVPFGCAGDNRGYAQLADEWAEIYARTLDVCLTVKKALSSIDEREDSYQPEVEKAELAHKLRFLFEFCYLKYALKLASVSWFREDVAPSWAITVHAPPQPQQGYPPNTFNYPKDLDSETKTQNWGKPQYKSEDR